MPPPTTRIVSVWPTPQSAPIIAAPPVVRWRVTMVVTAMTWSGSVACRMPRKNPSTDSARRPVNVHLDDDRDVGGVEDVGVPERTPVDLPNLVPFRVCVTDIVILTAP